MATEKRTIVALCAHPDDAEFRCGGTLLLLAGRGWDVHVVTLSAGDCGSAEEPPDVIMRRRRAEAEAAAARLGGSYHCLDGRDLQVYDDNATRAGAAALLREIDPDCVITHYPIDYMADHIAASAAARTAVFVAPMTNYLVGPAAGAPPSTRGVVPLYYFSPIDSMDFHGSRIQPEFYVDVSSVIGEKAELLACHESQRDWLRRQHGVDEYIEQMKRWDSEAGRDAGVSFAEGFCMHRGHAYPQTPLIQDALGELVRDAG